MKKKKFGSCGKIVHHFYTEYLGTRASGPIYASWTRQLCNLRTEIYYGQRVFGEDEIIAVIDSLIEKGIPKSEFPRVLNFPKLVDCMVDNDTDEINRIISYIKRTNGFDDSEQEGYWE